MKTVEAYIRYSDHKQDDGYSVEYQKSEILDYCSRNGLEMHQFHIDQAQTATKVAGRENFFRMIDRVKKGYVEMVIVYKMNRMFRNALESHQYRKLFRKHNVKLVSVTEFIDEDSSSGRLMTNVLSDIDQYQSETTSDFVKSSMREMARQGFYTGGVVTFGYKLQPIENGSKIRKKFVPNEPEAEIVRIMFNMYAKGSTLLQIQDHLISIGAVRRDGGKFSQTIISRILSRDTYIGTHRFKTKGYDEIVVENCIEPIISTEIWNIVKERKDRNKDGRAKPRRTGKRRTYALTGFAFCSECNDYYIGYQSGISKKRPKDIKRRYYTCRAKLNYRSCKALNIRKDFVEDAVLNAIKKHILNDTSIKQIAKKVSELCKDNPSETVHKIKSLRSQETKLEKRIGDLIELSLNGKISSTILSKKTEDAEKELQYIKNQIFVLSEHQKTIITQTDIEKELYKMLSSAENCNDDVLRTLVETFVEDIVISSDSVTINLKLDYNMFSAYNITDSPPFVSLSAEIKKTT